MVIWDGRFCLSWVVKRRGGYLKLVMVLRVVIVFFVVEYKLYIIDEVFF